MEFDHDEIRRVVNEDRLSNLPVEIIYQTLSCMDSKFSVQTCLLSPRWKLVWKSMPCLNFYSEHFGTLRKFAEFVTQVLSHRNHHIDVSSVKLSYRGAANQGFVTKIANYAFSHNVQELTVTCWPMMGHREFPSCLFSSPSLKHFTLGAGSLFALCVTPKTPWDFPALTTLHISKITLVDHYTRQPVDLFSKCVNLEKLTLESFNIEAGSVFDINSPRLSTLVLIKGKCSNLINVIAPQLENLTIIDCNEHRLNAPPGLSSFYYRGYHPPRLENPDFHSLNKVTLNSHFYDGGRPYKRGVLETMGSLLQALHSTRILTLNADIFMTLSLYLILIPHPPSPFSNLICLNVDCDTRDDAFNVKLSTEVRKFLLENSPSATFNIYILEQQPTNAMKTREARKRISSVVIEENDSLIMHTVKL